MTQQRPRLVVLISGTGSNMEALIKASQQGSLSGDIVAVFSNKPEAKGLITASAAGIATHTVNHKNFTDRESFDTRLAAEIKHYQPDLLILAGFMRILTPGFVRKFAGKLVNIHPSLLPKYPGLHTHQRAIDAGDQEAGVTVHFVTEELDGGPAIIQAKVPVLPTDTADTLAQRVLSEEHKIYPYAVELFCTKKIRLEKGKAFFENKPLAKKGLNFNAQ